MENSFCCHLSCSEVIAINICTISFCCHLSCSEVIAINICTISFCCHLSCSEVIAIDICTWQDNYAVVACAKICCNMVPYNALIPKPIVNRIWIMIENLLVKWAPDPISEKAQTVLLVSLWIIKQCLSTEFHNTECRYIQGISTWSYRWVSARKT